METKLFSTMLGIAVSRLGLHFQNSNFFFFSKCMYYFPVEITLELELSPAKKPLSVAPSQELLDSLMRKSKTILLLLQFYLQHTKFLNPLSPMQYIYPHLSSPSITYAK